MAGRVFRAEWAPRPGQHDRLPGDFDLAAEATREAPL
jgi:hypothetical protein